MGLRAIVRSCDYFEDDLDHENQHEEDDVFLSIDFDDVSVIKNLRLCVNELVRSSHITNINIVTQDYLFDCLENGGEIERSEIDELSEEILLIQDKIDFATFKSPEEKSSVEEFLEEINNLIEASNEAQANIEFFNNEFTDLVDNEDSDQEHQVSQYENEQITEEKGESDQMEKMSFLDDEFDDDEFEMDSAMRDELEREFELEYGEKPNIEEVILDEDSSKSKKNKKAK